MNKKMLMLAGAVCLAAMSANAGRTGPWPKEKAWEWSACISILYI